MHKHTHTHTEKARGQALSSALILISTVNISAPETGGPSPCVRLCDEGLAARTWTNTEMNRERENMVEIKKRGC